MEENQHKTDHDLIIRLDEKMDQMAASIKELKDGTQSRVDKIEATLVEVFKRLNELEQFRTAQIQSNKDMKNYWKLIFGLGILLLGLMSAHILGYHL